MASVTVYNRTLGQQYTVDLNIYNNVIAGSGSGSSTWYVAVSTSKRTAYNEAVKSYTIDDILLASLTLEVEAGITDIIERVEGKYASSSSSSNSSSSSSSSLNSSSSSLNSSSSSSNSSSSSSSNSSSSNSSSTVAMSSSSSSSSGL
jgi:hypothetical protein